MNTSCSLVINLRCQQNFLLRKKLVDRLIRQCVLHKLHLSLLSDGQTTRFLNYQVSMLNLLASVLPQQLDLNFDWKREPEVVKVWGWETQKSALFNINCSQTIEQNCRSPLWYQDGVVLKKQWHSSLFQLRSMWILFIIYLKLLIFQLQKNSLMRNAMYYFENANTIFPQVLVIKWKRITHEDTIHKELTLAVY